MIVNYKTSRRLSLETSATISLENRVQKFFKLFHFEEFQQFFSSMLVLK